MSVYEIIGKIVSEITAGTINGICLGFWIILIAEVWKWFWDVVKRFIKDFKKEDGE